MKKLIALVLSLVMALSLCAPAWGADSVSDLAGLQAATDEVTLTAKLTITADVELTNVTITTSVCDAFTVTSGATLTLGEGVVINATDAVLYANGGNIVVDGAVINVTSNVHGAAYVDSGCIEVKSGSINQIGNKTTLDVDGSSASAIVSGGAVTSSAGTALLAQNSGTVTISRGEVKTTITDPQFCAAYARNGGKITVTGTAEVDAAAGYGLVAVTGGDVTVAGGTVDGVKAHEAANAKATITGGTATGAVTAANGATISISGGTFEVAPTQYVDGSIAVAKVNNDYIVGADAIEEAATAGTTVDVLQGTVTLGDKTLGVGDEPYEVPTTDPEPTPDPDPEPTPDPDKPATDTDQKPTGTDTDIEDDPTDDPKDPTDDPTTPIDPPAGGDDSDEPDEPLAIVNGKEYDDFDAAVNAAIESGETLVITSGSKYTIKLAKGQSITVNNAAGAELNFDVPAGYKVKTTVNNDGTVTYKVVLKFGGLGGGNYNSTTNPDVTSPKTFDAGIALYVGMSVVAAAGTVVIGKKRKD